MTSTTNSKSSQTLSLATTRDAPRSKQLCAAKTPEPIRRKERGKRERKAKSEASDYAKVKERSPVTP